MTRHPNDRPFRRRTRCNWLLLPVLFIAAGCQPSLNTDYGESEGLFARRSVNGLTTFRSAFETAGWKDRNVSRLTDRVARVDTIVWTPTESAAIGTDATQWMEDWLAAPGKTLIFVLPDSGSEAEFFRQARPLASPSQRLEYRRRYAEALVRQHRQQVGRQTVASNGWFSAKPDVYRSSLNVPPGIGQFADSFELLRRESETNNQERQFEWYLESYDPVTATGSAAPTAAVPANGPPANGSANGPPANGPATVPTTGGTIAFVTPSSTETELQPVVTSDSGKTLVARINSEAWAKSQILVVAGGSMLTNYSLTSPTGQRLATALIHSARTIRDDAVASTGVIAQDTPPRVGFSNANGSMPVSESVDEVPRAVGAELLTVFPISFVTIHASVLGLVICLYL
ncbi:MAG: hypothetical protein AAFV88_14695, partial [Planctomycetota bacterium]